MRAEKPSRGVSPVIAVVLLIGLTVASIGMIMVILSTVAPSGPPLNVQPIVDTVFSPGKDTEGTVWENMSTFKFKHMGGEDEIRAEDINFFVSGTIKHNVTGEERWVNYRVDGLSLSGRFATASSPAGKWGDNVWASMWPTTVRSGEIFYVVIDFGRAGANAKFIAVDRISIVHRPSNTTILLEQNPPLVSLPPSPPPPPPPLPGLVKLWENSYDTPGENDFALGVATDSENNIIVVGGVGYGWDSENIRVWKYDPNGTLLWMRTYVYGGYANDVAVDSNNNIIAIGYDGDDLVTLKYSPAGVLLYENRITPVTFRSLPITRENYVRDSTSIDAPYSVNWSGNNENLIAVAARNSDSLAVFRYDNLTRTLVRENYVKDSVAIDYASGVSWGPWGYSGLIAVVGENSDTLAIFSYNRYTKALVRENYIKDNVAIDGASGISWMYENLIAVTGRNSDSLAIFSYDGSTKRLVRENYIRDTTAIDGASGVTWCPTDWTSPNLLLSVVGRNIDTLAVFSYNKNTKRLVRENYIRDTTAIDAPSSVSWNFRTSPEVMLAAVGQNSDTLAIFIYDNNTKALVRENYIKDNVAIDGASSVVFCPHLLGPPVLAVAGRNTDTLAIFSYYEDTNCLVRENYIRDSTAIDGASGVCWGIDPWGYYENKVVVTGEFSDTIAVFALNLSSWPGVIAIESGGVAVFPNNDFVVSGITSGYWYGENDKILVRKYDQNNNRLWDNMYSPNQLFTTTFGGTTGDVAVDSNNNIFVAYRFDRAGPPINFTDHLLLKYDTNGRLIWDNRYDALGGWDSAYGVAVDSNGNAVTAGYTSIFVTGYGFTIKWAPNGNVVWATQWSESDSSGCGVAVDKSGNYATLMYRWTPARELIIAGYNPSGELVYLQRYSSGIDDWPGSIAVDRGGNIIIVGYSGMYDLGDSHTIVVKYAAPS